jgi:quinolinate synthase
MKSEIANRIQELKKEKNAVVLAHFYQEKSIQDIADFVGDSYSLSLEAAKTNASIILFAGVHFMAETAKILNPTKKVLLPDLDAGCSLADSCDYLSFEKLKEENPDHVVVTYINCSAAIKTLSDYVCTSSNALKIINSIPTEKKILFAPDKNLGRHLESTTGRKMLLWDGACVVHEAFSFDKLSKLIRENPGVVVVAHPESTTNILDLAQFIGSTSEMINYVKNSPKRIFIIATEAGIMHKMQEAVPDKILIPAPSIEENTCACSECAYMKVNTLKKLYDCLLNETPSIQLSEETIWAARLPIERMIQITENHE